MKKFILGLFLGFVLKMAFGEIAVWIQFKDGQFCVRNAPVQSMLTCYESRQEMISRQIFNTLYGSPFLFDYFLD